MPTSEKPIPLGTVSGSTGKPKYLKPWNYIKENFKATGVVPFGSMGSLGGKYVVISDIHIVRAALECGYGRRSKWTSALALKPHEAKGLASYLLLRLQMVAACIESDGNQAKIPRSFYRRVESSEKVALSFILSGIGTYLAARKWLNSGGYSVKSFLHAGIYTKAVNGAGPPVALSAALTKSPDYLVESGNGEWHVFESKGGRAGARWARIAEGLVQLSNFPKISWNGKSPEFATTCVCVHTSVDSDCTLKVVAVDPPGESDSAGARRPIALFEGVCKLLLLLETVEQYYALADGDTAEVELAQENWRFASSARFGGLVVGIPNRYLNRESDVRWRLAVYLAVIETIEDQALVRRICAGGYPATLRRPPQTGPSCSTVDAIYHRRVDFTLAAVPSARLYLRRNVLATGFL